MNKPRDNSTRSVSGFTLVEVSIAMAVALIGLLAVIGMVANGLKSSRSAIDNAIPAMIANDIFSQVRATYSTYWNGASLNTSSKPTDPNLYYDAFGVTNNVTPYYQVAITYANDITFPVSLQQGVTLVQVRVYWPSGTTNNANIFATKVVKLW